LVLSWLAEWFIFGGTVAKSKNNGVAKLFIFLKIGKIKIKNTMILSLLNIIGFSHVRRKNLFLFPRKKE